ncbi:MAG: 4Fe-4S dicluster domain-containing protein [Rikenellaceae bacterium]|nr:4Fe-4S dicluster domain-containing protein [Rikenellaceae bacterium]MDE7133839.1 4Fe-4S dicluster domain-containing protein [Rikenellaceae bacterium]MDE7356150.1 4Fe-4S dicluster domain-containing protein [Rikenellaceae bacterium]
MAKIKGRVDIDIERCKGCGVCVASCPVSVLSLSPKVNSRGYNYAMAVRAEECIGCASCGIVCPDSCITIYRSITPKQEQ